MFGEIYIKYGIEKLLLNLTSSFLTPCCNVFLNQNKIALPMVYNMTIFEELDIEAKIWQDPKSVIIKMAWLPVIREGPAE